MLTQIRSSRRELLAAMEGKAPRDLLKRLLQVKDLGELKNMANGVKKLGKLENRAQVKKLVEKYANRDDNKLVNLLQVQSEMRKVLEPPSANRQILTIRYTAYDKRAYMAGHRLAKACQLMGIKYSGPVGLPQKTHRWTVLKSPFKYKKHQESWEQREVRSVVSIDTEDRGELIPNLLRFLEQTNYTGVNIKIKSRRFISPEQIYTDPYIKEKLSTTPAAPNVSYGDFNLEDAVLSEALKAKLEAPSSSTTTKSASQVAKKSENATL